MPLIASFYGIAIYMYFDDHNPPHFHAVYGEHEAKVAISSGDVVEGSLPRRAARLVREWTLERVPQLMDNWDRARSAKPLLTVTDLDAD